MSSTKAAIAPLNRSNLSRAGKSFDAPPVRIVHLGLGAFHRSHQAWFTDRASDAELWGIASYTGRSPAAATALSAQDGLFTLIERSDAGDEATIVRSISAAVDGADLASFTSHLAAPTTAIVTLTITEAGYHLTHDGAPDLGSAAVSDDLTRLRRIAASAGDIVATDDGPTTALGRLLLGLEQRRRADVGALAVVPCDNLAGNGRVVEQSLVLLAEEFSPELAQWIRANVSFVSTSVDRITPSTRPADLVVAAELTGWHDAMPVVAEPFADWTLSGEFPMHAPDWGSAGARFVDDIDPFECRKLWMLNGAHSLLAYSGLRRGHRTVNQAIADPICFEWAMAFWAEAGSALPDAVLDVAAYRDALIDRFTNSRIEHELAQIAVDGLAKLRLRVVEPALSALRSGRPTSGSARAIGSWMALVLGGVGLPDSQSTELAKACRGTTADQVARLLELVDPGLSGDSGFAAEVADVVTEQSPATLQFQERSQ